MTSHLCRSTEHSHSKTPVPDRAQSLEVQTPLKPRGTDGVRTSDGVHVGKRVDSRKRPRAPCWRRSQSRSQSFSSFVGSGSIQAVDFTQNSGTDCDAHALYCPKNSSSLCSQIIPPGRCSPHCPHVTWPLPACGTRPLGRRDGLSPPERDAAPQPDQSAWPPP